MCAMSSNCGWTHTWMHLPNMMSQSLTVWLTKTIEVFSFKFWKPDVRLQSMNRLCVFVGLVMVHLHFHLDDSASPKHTHLKLSVSFNWEGVTFWIWGTVPWPGVSCWVQKESGFSAAWLQIQSIISHSARTPSSSCGTILPKTVSQNKSFGYAFCHNNEKATKSNFSP